MQLYTPNPHYVELRGKPALLVGSGEHYGALINLEFDYQPYLETLARSGLNLLRIFSGAYRENPGEFSIKENVLAPNPKQFISPWMETGSGQYDLSQFNPDYFARLHNFMQAASERGIVVELSLFCFWYNTDLWEASPMHPANNIQGVGPTDREQVYTLSSSDLLPYQEALVSKLVTELNGYDNLYFEICNEPYSRHDHTAYLDWQHHLVEQIAQAEKDLPNQHLIAINYQNRTHRITNLHPAVSVCNFHYALADAVKENYHLGRLIADDETGFLGQISDPYRREAWLFMLAGGGAFSHLDYSFTLEHPDGSAQIEGSTPGYGGEDLRQQLGFMKRFLESVEVWKMIPYNEMLAWNAGLAQAQVMCIPNEIYIAYFSNNWPGNVQPLALPGGNYQLEWINPVSGNVFSTQDFEHSGGYRHVWFPSHAGDLLMKLRKVR